MRAHCGRWVIGEHVGGSFEFWRSARPGKSFGQVQSFSPGGYKRWHTVRTRYEDGKRTWGRYEAVIHGTFVGRCPYCTV